MGGFYVTRQAGGMPGDLMFRGLKLMQDLKKTATTLLAGAMALAIFTGTASAASVTVGNGDDGNCYPFACAARDGVTQYQEQYNRTAFTGPLTFNALRFNQNVDYGPNNLVPFSPLMDSATYSVSFYLSNPGFGSLGEDLEANKGAFLGNFGSFTLGGNIPSVLSLYGQTLNYDPSQGDLLMNVGISNVTATQGDYANFFNADSTSNVVSRAWTGTQDGAYGASRDALQTTFDLVVSAAPEPATWAMMILGFGVAGISLRRRRTGLRPARA